MRTVYRGPHLYAARRELELHAAEVDWNDPCNWGGTQLIWRLFEEAGRFVVAGVAEGEL